MTENAALVIGVVRYVWIGVDSQMPARSTGLAVRPAPRPGCIAVKGNHLRSHGRTRWIFRSRSPAGSINTSCSFLPLTAQKTASGITTASAITGSETGMPRCPYANRAATALSVVQATLRIRSLEHPRYTTSGHVCAGACGLVARRLSRRTTLCRKFHVLSQSDQNSVKIAQKSWSSRSPRSSHNNHGKRLVEFTPGP